jgi:hypothetical protein
MPHGSAQPVDDGYKTWVFPQRVKPNVSLAHYGAADAVRFVPESFSPALFSYL